jgi:hypothetical protein
MILLVTALVSLAMSLLLNESLARTSILGTTTCQSQRGTAAGALQNLGGNCNSNGNGFSNVAADDLESNSKGCEIHGIQSPNNNVFLKVGCHTK